MGRLAQGRGAWQVGTSVGTFRGIKQLVETQQLKILVLVLPKLPALAYFCLLHYLSVHLCFSLFFSSPLSYITEGSDGPSPHRPGVFFPV